MLKHLWLLCLLLGMVFILCGCGRFPGNTASPPPAQTYTEEPLSHAPLAYLYFSERNSYFKRVQAYEFRAENGVDTAYFHMANEEIPYSVAVDPAWTDALTSIISSYGMMGWNGFSGSDPGLLDGTHFFVEFTLVDGVHIQASGYGEFPENYGKAASALDALFLHLLPEDMRDW